MLGGPLVGDLFLGCVCVGLPLFRIIIFMSSSSSSLLVSVVVSAIGSSLGLYVSLHQ